MRFHQSLPRLQKEKAFSKVEQQQNNNSIIHNKIRHKSVIGRSSSVRTIVCMSLLWFVATSAIPRRKSNNVVLAFTTRTIIAARRSDTIHHDIDSDSKISSCRRRSSGSSHLHRFDFWKKQRQQKKKSPSLLFLSTISSSSNNDEKNNLTKTATATATTTSKTTTTTPKKKKTNDNTGGLRRLPVVKSPPELMDKAKRSILYVKPDSEIKNVRNRARKHATITLDTMMQSLCVPLRDIVNGYKRELRRLHPFECVVADLTVRARQRKDGVNLQNVLDEIHEGRKMVLESGKDWVARAKHAPTAREAGMAMNEGTERLLDLYEEFLVTPIDDIVSLQKSLRSAPIIELNKPAVVLVGAPNVGKSSIVRTISTGVPEINNYPFTTRGMTLGHVELLLDNCQTRNQHDDDDQYSNNINNNAAYDSVRCQVMDTPGLLVREKDDERNEMEALTMASMQHLPTAVMYVMDLSGQAGDKFSSVEDQLQLRREVRKRFPRRPWIDVVSKIDLGVDSDSIKELEEEILNDGEKYIQLSIHEGIGIEDLQKEVIRMLGEVRIVLEAIAASTTTTTRA